MLLEHHTFSEKNRNAIEACSSGKNLFAFVELLLRVCHLSFISLTDMALKPDMALKTHTNEGYSNCNIIYHICP